MKDPKDKRGYYVHLEQETVENADFRRVLYTGSQIQLVLMSLRPGEDIGLETHPENDQFFRFDEGEGKVVINGNEYTVTDGDAIIVPKGAEHNIINTSSDTDLKFYTIYAPAHHKDGIVRHIKEEALAHEADFDGVTTE